MIKNIVILMTILVLTVACSNFLKIKSQPYTSNNITSEFFVGKPFPYFHTKTEVFLDNEITSNQGQYNGILMVLNQASRGDVVEFHLSGYGGDLQSTVYLITNIRDSLAHTVMTVEAPVYSAHAYIAASGTELVMRPGTYLMFHFSTMLNVDCNTVTGEDRGVSNVEHCAMLKEASITSNAELLSSFSILTTEEIISMANGHDVYLTDEEVNQRLANVN